MSPIEDIIDDIIEEEEATLPTVETKPIEITEQAKENEEELEKIVPIEENKALKTKSASKKWLIALLFISVNILAILLTAIMEFIGDDHPASIHRAWETFMENWVWLVVGFGCVAVAITVQALKRFVLLKKTLNKNLPILCLNSVILCKYYDNITPLGAGGQPFEIYYLRKKGIPVGIASGVPLVSYSLDKIAYVVVSVTAIICYGFKNVSTFVKVLSCIGLAVNLMIPVAILFFTVLPKVGEATATFVSKVGKKVRLVKDEKAFAHKLTGSIKEYAACINYFTKKSKLVVLLAFCCSLCYYLAMYSLPYVTIRMAGNNNVSWGQMFNYCVICYATVTLLPTPGGAGGAELSFRSIFAQYLSAGMVFWGMLSWRIFSYYTLVLTGLILIIVQQIGKFTKKVVTGEPIFTSHIKKEEIPEGDELEPYTPIPTGPTQEDDINTIDSVVKAETTIEPDEIVDVAPDMLSEADLEPVVEFTAVIESKSTVKITEEKIEHTEHKDDLTKQPAQDEHAQENGEKAQGEQEEREPTTAKMVEHLAELLDEEEVNENNPDQISLFDQEEQPAQNTPLNGDDNKDE